MEKLKKFLKSLSNNQHNQSKRTTRWGKFEDRCKNSSVFNGYTVHTQKHSKSTNTRADFVGYKKNSKERIVADAKWCLKASAKHVKQVSRYKGHPHYADKGVIFYPKNVDIPDKVRTLAQEKNVKIIKKQIEKIKERFFPIVGKKKYQR